MILFFDKKIIKRVSTGVSKRVGRKKMRQLVPHYSIGSQGLALWAVAYFFLDFLVLLHQGKTNKIFIKNVLGSKSLIFNKFTD